MFVVCDDCGEPMFEEASVCVGCGRIYSESVHIENPFNRYMTFSEARAVLFSNIDGKTPEEKALLFEAYAAVLPEIIEREVKERMCMN